MPRMPEIVGETQDSGPSLEENRSAESPRLRAVRGNAYRQERRRPGIRVSPLVLRLIDFSCEGERAPPV